MAESIASSDTRDLWREIKKIRNTGSKRAPHIDGVTDPFDIASLFSNKYKDLYNSVPSNIADIIGHVNDNICLDKNTDFVISYDILEEAICKLKINKSDGDKGLWSNLVINAPLTWKMMLSNLLSSMILHGHTPDDILMSTISSLPKSHSSDICNSKYYRGIALTSSINKVLEWVILLKHGDELKTSNLQFAYKSDHSTSMCTLTLKEVAKYYTSRQ